MMFDDEARQKELDRVLGPVDPVVIAKTNPAADGQPSVWVLCPCCHGHARLAMQDAREPDNPSQKVDCCHCASQGVIPLDMRSTNIHE